MGFFIPNIYFLTLQAMLSIIVFFSMFGVQYLQEFLSVKSKLTLKSNS